MIANVVRNILSPSGTLLPSSFRMPREKAISVAIGMPHPSEPGFPEFRIRNSTRGKNIPPIAAKNGKDAFFRDDSSPPSISLFDLKTNHKENIAIKPSFIQRKSGFDRPNPPKLKDK